MQIKHGLISCDSHAQLDKDAWTKRMSKAKFGDAIPQIRDTTSREHMIHASDKPVQRWFVNGKVVGERGTVNCPTAMGDPMRKTYPQRWEEVPVFVYDPAERLKALDRDGIDAEVLFPNDPVQSAAFLQGDAEFELACVQAYNDGLAEYTQVSDRYIPLALIPYMSDIDAAVKETERAVKNGHRGITMVAEPSMVRKQFKHFNDPWWDPLWACCQSLNVPVHWHAGAGIALRVPRWKGYTANQGQAMGPAGGFSVQAQFIPNLIFSGVLDRYPKLNWVCAETGIGWVNYMLETCDHEWERRHLWTQGILTRPSELFQRQIYVDFWYERAGIELRHKIGMKNIMWESDFPHSTSTYPESRAFIDRTLQGVPKAERDQLAYGNAMRLYNLA
ncbi:MAG: amidohydrolase [Betaproteobacteria bacterium]|nr:amidohydrolase [Betaproteobacteria bacterium]